MAPRPSSSGISRSMSTRSGAWSCTFFKASMPFRAVATTSNSSVPSTTSLRRRRKKGLSSTTRTVRRSEGMDTMRHRADFEEPIGHGEPDGAAVVAAHRFPRERDAMLVEGLPGGNHVAVAHLDGAGRGEGGEHAGAAYQPPR